MNEYNELMHSLTDVKKKELVRNLKPLAKSAYMHLEQLGIQLWSNYKKLWSMKEWKEAREILKEYFTEDGKLICPICNKEITRGYTLDHKKYPPKNKTYLIFHPSYCQIICSKHHNEKFHVKMKFFNVFDSTHNKIGELAQFSDEWCVLHYTVNTYPKNEWGKARSIKIQITKQNWSYEEVVR